MLIIHTFCSLYPNSLAAIVSGSFRQSKKVLEDKYKRDLCQRSPFLAQEEKKFTCSIQQAKLELWNGSVIEAVPLGDGK